MFRIISSLIQLKKVIQKILMWCFLCLALMLMLLTLFFIFFYSKVFHFKNRLTTIQLNVIFMCRIFLLISIDVLPKTIYFYTKNTAKTPKTPTSSTSEISQFTFPKKNLLPYPNKNLSTLTPSHIFTNGPPISVVVSSLMDPSGLN